jgi:hypothetical protein
MIYLPSLLNDVFFDVCLFVKKAEGIQLLAITEQLYSLILLLPFHLWPHPKA